MAKRKDKRRRMEAQAPLKHFLEDSALKELFMCTKCTKSYRLKHSLTRHMKFECNQEPKYCCAFCEKRFKHKYDLNVHQKTKHVKEEAVVN